LKQDAWSLFRQALRDSQFAGRWCLLPLVLLLELFTDWEVVDRCQEAIAEQFGRRLPEELVRGLLARVRWLAGDL